MSALNRPGVSVMVAGIDDVAVRAILGDSVPASVLEWFSWCNGVLGVPGQRNDDVAIIPGYAPVSLVDAAVMRSTYEGDPVLFPNWIPLLVSPGGDIYAAVWSNNESAKVAGVLVGEPTEIEFDNVEQMIAVFTACVERGAFFVNDRRLWSMDSALYDSVYAEITYR